jgi:hypothetical protein
MTKSQQTERDDAIARLREWLKPGDTVYTILRHCSRSGMARVIELVTIKDNEPIFLGYNASLALGITYDQKRDGVKVGGTGMDMGFHLVYTLSSTLWPDGFECIGCSCTSNDHFNGDRDYTPHHHTDGGYALKQRWL